MSSHLWVDHLLADRSTIFGSGTCYSSNFWGSCPAKRLPPFWGVDALTFTTSTHVDLTRRCGFDPVPPLTNVHVWLLRIGWQPRFGNEAVRVNVGF